MSELVGKIIVIGNTETVGSAGTFQKRLIVIETDEKYSQKVPLDFVQDKCDLLDKFTIGQEVTIGYNIRGNEYNNKYYVSLNGWQIKANDTSKQSPEPNTQKFETVTVLNDDDDSGLPF
jgi:hypothetical protein